MLFVLFAHDDLAEPHLKNMTRGNDDVSAAKHVI
jgi:hypothetical protein